MDLFTMQCSMCNFTIKVKDIKNFNNWICYECLKKLEIKNKLKEQEYHNICKTELPNITISMKELRHELTVLYNILKDKELNIPEDERNPLRKRLKKIDNMIAWTLSIRC